MTTPTPSPSQPAPPAAAAELPRILCVDDEASIVAALRRMFRPHGYEVMTANSGREGLAQLDQTPVDLIISDMRMPEMDGAAFLEQAKQRWPDTQRILLTGFADLESTIAAINRAEVFRYIAKPWNEDDLLRTVRSALEQRRLQCENARLLALTQRQNEELRALNAGLEEKVAARTAELQQTVSFLDAAHQELKGSFLTMVQVMISLLELHSRKLAGHARRVAETGRQLARALNNAEADPQDVMLAGLLHDIGKFGQSERLAGKSFHAMNAAERAEEMQHPARGEAVLTPIAQLKKAAALVRHHHECFDGTGFPDHLVGLAIPLGARILAVANDFDALQMGTLVSRALKPAEARAFILANRGKRYDPSVVDAFMTHVGDQIPEEIQELSMRPGTLAPGMVLSRDLQHPDGFLLLAKGQVVDETIIRQLVKIESSEGHRLTLFILPQNPTGS